MSFDNVQALPPGTRLGDYRLDAMIGHGGFGITYRAFDSQLAKVVAIKEYLPVEFAMRQADGQVVPRSARLADDFAWGRERFLDEARALARFRHPHIVPVLRFFEANGTAYTVMEFEDGKSVAELLREPGRRLPPDDVRRLAEGLLRGLGAVHAQGFLHRDIKPSNIIIRRDGVPILIDFGAARQAMGGRTRTLTGVLTPQYAPIEQYAARRQAGPVERHLLRRRRAAITRSPGQPPPEAAAPGRQGSLSAVGRHAGRSLRAGVPGRDRPGAGLRAGRAAAERRGVERAVRRVAAQRPRCADAAPCLRSRRRAAAPGRRQPRKHRAAPRRPPPPRSRSRRRSSGALGLGRSSS